MSRRPPTPSTIRALFAKSGNVCAFPKCEHKLVEDDNLYVSEVCHIEAAEPQGPRYNPNSTDDERRGYSNLILLCHAHHRRIDFDENTYTVEVLRHLKTQGEANVGQIMLPISSSIVSQVEREMADQFWDYTGQREPTKVRNLSRLYEVIGLNLEQGQIQEEIAEVNEHLDSLARVPVNVVQFVVSIARRIYVMSNSGAVHTDPQGEQLMLSDYSAAHQFTDSKTRGLVKKANAYGLAMIDCMQSGSDKVETIRLMPLPSGCLLWGYIVEFCEKTGIESDVFVEQLNFSAFDS